MIDVLFATGRTFPDEYGGLARLVAARARGLAARGRRVAVVTRNPGSLPAHELRDGYEVHRFDSAEGPLVRYHASYLAGARLAAALAHRRQAALIDIHHPLLGAALMSRAPRVYNFYASWAAEWLQEEQSRARRGPARRLAAGGFHQYLLAAERRAARRAARVLVLSDYSRTLAASTLRCDARALRQVPGSVDLQRFLPGPPDRARFDLPDGPLLLAVRRLVPRMGLERLLDALPALPGVSLALAGSGPLEGALRQRAERLGLAGRVRFLGRVADEELPALYRSADLGVVPTAAYEGFGLVVLESLACGVPVVTSDAGALPELVDPLDPRLVAHGPLAETIRAALARAPSSAACRAHAERWSSEREIDRLEAVYGEVLGG